MTVKKENKKINKDGATIFVLLYFKKSAVENNSWTQTFSSENL